MRVGLISFNLVLVARIF